MKKTKILEIALAGALAFALFSCSFPGGSSSGLNNGSGNGSGADDHTAEDQPISGPLTVAETWAGKDANNNPITYYINSTYYIQTGGTLTISAGAIVKLGPNGKIYIKKGGALIASNVIFTSSKDSRGRKILAAGDTEPWQGDWLQIEIYEGHAEFKDCEFSYGGNGCSTVNIEERGATCRIDGCKFTFCAGDREVKNKIKAALRYEGNVTFDNDENTPDNMKNLVTNTTFENNVWPLSIPPYFDISGTNHFGTGDKANEYNLIHLEMSDINARHIKKSVVWETQEVPYLYSTNNQLSIENILTIKGGTAEKPTVVEFADAGIYIADDGELRLENNIRFTNCEKSPTSKFGGLYCYVNNSVKVNNHTKTINKVLMEKNESKNIIVENYEVSAAYTRGSNYDDWVDHRIKTIQNTNNKSVFAE